jgi:hypothetical protein
LSTSFLLIKLLKFIVMEKTRANQGITHATLAPIRHPLSEDLGSKQFKTWRGRHGVRCGCWAISWAW